MAGEQHTREVTDPIGLTDSATFVMRNYFSTYLLWAAHDFCMKAQAIERADTAGKSRLDVEHRALVIASVTSAAGFVEAMVNELFQDAFDGHGTEGDGYLAPLSDRTRRLMAGWWRASGNGFERVLDKYQLLLLFADQPKLDEGAEPFQGAGLLVQLRNTVMHYRPEDVSADVEHRFTKALRGRFDDNKLMGGSGNPWWPDHALGAGCASWAFESAQALTDKVSHELHIAPNYKRHHASGWLPLP